MARSTASWRWTSSCCHTIVISSLRADCAPLFRVLSSVSLASSTILAICRALASCASGDGAGDDEGACDGTGITYILLSAEGIASGRTGLAACAAGGAIVSGSLVAGGADGFGSGATANSAGDAAAGASSPGRGNQSSGGKVIPQIFPATSNSRPI